MNEGQSVEADVVARGLPRRSASRSSKTMTVRRVACAALVAGIVVKTGLLLLYALHMRWVMDEFAQGYSGRFVALGLYTKIDPIKTALPHLAFYGAIELGRSATEILYFMRAETALAALLTVCTVALAARQIYQSALSTLFAVFVLLCFSNFIEHSFRVRNDSFAVLFAILSLAVLLRTHRSLWGTYGSGLLAGTAFLCTQKVVYHVVAILLAQLVFGWREAGLHAALTRSIRYGVGVSVALVAYGVAFGGADAARVIGAVFLAPLELQGHLLSDAAFPGIRHYVGQTVERNVFAYFICSVGLFTTLVFPRNRTPMRLASGTATGLISAAVFLHPQPWPYVFVMCMPFLALFAPASLEWFTDRWHPACVLAAVALLSLSFQRNIAVLSHGNADQFRVVRQAEAMLGPKDRYFDGVAMLPTHQIAGRHPWWWWDAPMTAALRRQLARGDKRNFVSILEQQPKIWILNYRFSLLGKALGPFLTLGTVRVSDVVLVSGRSIAPGNVVPFRNLWPGTYHLVGSDGRPSSAIPVVDGRPCATPCRISVGNHEVASSGVEPAFLLPSDVVPPGPLPVREPPFELYAGIYDF
jgi:hypothetical protein